MELIIGTKKFSTWSLRPWILMKELGIPFTEKVIKLHETETTAEILKYSPAGKVPCLRDGETFVWDSLSIFEYLAESYPGVWPQDRKARAWARSACAEMHSGFANMRKHLSGEFVDKGLTYESTPEVEADIARIESIWMEGLARWKGPYLCGPKFSGIDAMYAPVALGRFIPYSVPLEPALKAYVQRLSELVSFKEWLQGA